jgi:rhodanese-related sulfurtransferase
VGRESIDAKTLREWLEKRKPVTVVDVHHAEEHAEWSVPGSVNFDAYDKLKSGDPDAMNRLEVFECDPVVTVCGAGRSRPVSPAPENHQRIVELNRSGLAPEGDLTQLEAGANRCAAG